VPEHGPYRPPKDAWMLLNPLFFAAYALLEARKGADTGVDYREGVDYRRALGRIAKFHIHINAALPGAVFQNPHWDVVNLHGAHPLMIVDLPLMDVGKENAPLQVWPGTHELAYSQVLRHPEVIVGRSNNERQYASCFPEFQNLTHSRPSKRILSSLGDAIVRTPCTWHRGTPNRTPETRDMLTLIVTPTV
jgi:ectoine hydroxylase-related dioxygenase (phytanoyl-CoA dioxygenase family)